MAIFLDEEMFGDDVNCIAYPHVLVCMAFGVLFDDNLFGVHLSAGDQDLQIFNIDNLARHITNRWYAIGNATAVYGCCNLKARYQEGNGIDGWEAEMRTLTGRLGYQGTVYGFDTSIINSADGTYVEYRPVYAERKCRVFFTRDKEMSYTGQPNELGMLPNIGRTSAYRSRNVGRGVALPPASFRVSATAKTSLFHRGKIHEVGDDLRLSSFRV